MAAYYNEHDPFAAQWLRNLIAAGHIAPGDVDERDIRDVRPDELRAYTQCHFFAGVGVWSHALRSAGWPDDRPLWTGSCPCQPFSAAGKGGGFDDERHLWPAFFHLIEQCGPRVVFGEQVASKDGLAWLDLVQADLEGAGYATGALDLCAAGFGAPHIRQRLYWLADAERERWIGRGSGEASLGAQALDSVVGLRAVGLVGHDDDDERSQGHGRDGNDSHQPRRLTEIAPRSTRPTSAVGALALANDTEWRADTARRHVGNGAHAGRPQGAGDVEGRGGDGGLGVANSAGSFAGRQAAATDGHRDSTISASGRNEASPTDGHWRDADWLLCRDGKWRPVEPGTFPLAHGATSRVGRLRAYGNAIVATQAEEFVAAYLTLPVIDVGVIDHARTI